MRPFSLSFRMHRFLAVTAGALLMWLSAVEASAGLVQTSGQKSAFWSAPRTENAAATFTVGNTVIVSMAFFGSSGIDMASVEIAGTTATQAVRSSALPSGGEVSAIIYYAKIVNSGRSDVVMNGDGNTNATTLSIDEWSGIEDNPLDKIGIATANPGSTPSASTGTLAQAGELVYFAFSYYGSNQTSITGPSGYTSVFQELNGSSVAGGASYYKIVSSTASETPTATLATSTPWRATVATFKLSAPLLSINDVTQTEGNGPGTTMMNFNVTLSTPAPPGRAGFTYVTSNLTASDASDYVAQGPTTGSIGAGLTSTTVSIPINGDIAIEAFETFNVTLSNPTGTSVTILDGVGVGTIGNDDAVPTGRLVISEFRLKGPAGSADEFIEIANPTTTPVTVFTTNASAGFSVADATGTLVFTIPNGTTIPARGHFLGANAAGPSFAAPYSLKDYGGVDAAIPDATWTIDLADDRGLAIFDTANSANYGTAIVHDAVGFTTDPALYKEGAGLVGIGAAPTPNNHSFVRKYVYGAGGAVQDMNLNATDWVLVATNAGLYNTTNAVLGGPSPENLAAEKEFGNALLTSSGTGRVAAPGPPKSLEFRRTFTNNTGGTLNSIRFKVIGLTGINNTVAGQADLRPTTSAAAGLFRGLTLEAPPGYSLVTPSIPPGTLPNGGLNSTLRLSSGLPLLAGQPVSVNFRVEYTISGGSFFYWLVPEAK